MAINYLNSVNLNQNELIKGRIENQASDALAGTGVDGQLYFNTTNDKLKIWKNGGWTEVDDFSIGFNFDTNTGVLTATVQNEADVTVDLDGRYTLLGDADLYDYWTLSDGTNSTNISSTDTATFQGTGSEVTVEESGGTVTIGLPNDVAIANDLGVGGNLVVSGDLTVSGTTTIINTETVTIADNIVTLNSNATGSATEDAGIEVERGNDTNVSLVWNETNDRWSFTNDGSTYHNIPVSDEYDNFYLDVSVVGSGTQEVSDGGVLTFDQGGGLTATLSGDDTVTYSHADTSSQASVDNSGRTYIQDITLDTYGHITGITSATETVTDTQLATAAALIDVSAMGSNTTASFTHSLASKNLIVQMYDVTTGEVVFADVDHTSINEISIIFAQTPTNDIRVVVIDAKNSVADSTVTYS